MIWLKEHWLTLTIVIILVAGLWWWYKNKMPAPQAPSSQPS